MNKTIGTAGSWVAIVGYVPPKGNAITIIHGKIKKHLPPPAPKDEEIEIYE